MTTLTQSETVSPRAPRLLDEQGVRFAIAHAGLVITAVSAAVLHLPLSSGLVLLGLTASIGGLALSPVWALGLGISAWAFYTGFLENRLGQLTLAEPDLLRLGGVLTTVLLASLLLRAEAHHV